MRAIIRNAYLKVEGKVEKEGQEGRAEWFSFGKNCHDDTEI